jgi:hypothetical protein
MQHAAFNQFQAIPSAPSSDGFRVNSPVFNRSGHPLKPWELAASRRAPVLQDASMMPGFVRRSISKIIADAQAKRMRLTAAAGIPQVYKEVKYPVMTVFQPDEFVRVRKEFYAATRASMTSCLFKEFKDCLSDTVRTTATRRFLMTDSNFTALDDSVFQGWLNVLFEPKSKKDAIDRLEALQFPEHDDKFDSQNEFMPKLETFAFDFELIINDIADTHETWTVETNGLDSGELTCKEVMKIWREKFSKNGRQSVQMKECRKFMDRNLEMLFSDNVRRLSEHFDDIDAKVTGGSMKYSTTPSSKRPTNAKGSSDRSMSSRQSFLPRKRSSPTELSARGDRPARQHMNPSPGSRRADKADSGRKIFRGADRGIACGHVTNHFGGGRIPKYCVFVGTKHDKNKNGHVWKDSDKEDSVHFPSDEYEALCKARPDALKNQGILKDQFNGAKHNLRVAALQAGEDVSESGSDTDEDDAVALRDEFNDPVDSDHDSVDSQVNSANCTVSALSASAARGGGSDIGDVELGKHLFRANRMSQFFGKSRIVNDSGEQTFVKTLMDSGAEFYIPLIANLCELRRLPLQVALFQGRKRQCGVQMMSCCRFELQNKTQEYIKHVEWFILADLGYEMLLGRKFCKDNGFSQFDELLEQW